jgi:hypothetical protein
MVWGLGARAACLQLWAGMACGSRSCPYRIDFFEDLMVYFGKVKNGKIEVEQGGSIPEGTVVRIEPIKVGADPADDLGAEAVDMEQADLASQHDHYIYGTPKKKG